MKTLLQVFAALGLLMTILPFAFPQEAYARWETGARAKLTRLSEAAGKNAAAAWVTISGALAAIGVVIYHSLPAILNTTKQHPQEISAAGPTIVFWVAVIIGIPLAYVVGLFLVHIACRILATFPKGVVAGFSVILGLISAVLLIFV